jgi:hypothetical protein
VISHIEKCINAIETNIRYFIGIKLGINLGKELGILVSKRGTLFMLHITKIPLK